MMNMLDMAARAGLQILLDARIGNETYHSVSGSLASLQRFADAVAAATRAEVPHASSPKAGIKPSRLRCAAARRRRARHLVLRCRRQSILQPVSASLASARSNRLAQIFPNRVGKKMLRVRQ